MKIQLGRCLLLERLHERGMTIDELAQALFYKPERLSDFIGNTRIMPLQAAISIADTIGCNVRDLYELSPIEANHETGA
ncbi:helix-turn-helix domain-containing protein [Paenibacillus sp. MBLB4367]|uniref:helix-turn-helix domain-containing protein n=1 Tax=Paenibacillus sp. MBLB4367 TaxID=3384767 RepID=UPI0039083CF4